MGNNDKKKGFASLSKERLKEISRKGGLEKSPTKGFGSMDPERHKQVSAKGGKFKLSNIKKGNNNNESINETEDQSEPS